MVLHQPQQLLLGLQYHDEPNYNFAYEVNDAHTGDIKSQHESRRGQTVLGQYSLLQPDGIRRTVDYRSDDHSGFQATVNNDGRPVNQYAQNGNNDITRHPNGGVQSYQGWPALSAPHPTQAATPIAISRSSFVQTFSHGSSSHNPWA